MYRQPMYTGQRPSSEPTFCSALIHKIVRKSHKHSEDEKEQQSKLVKTKKSKSENASGSDKENSHKNGTSKKQHRNEIKHIVAKLKKITSTLPHALRSSDAYEQGVRGCETCEMTREEYKRVMQTVKVIDILVDGVIEKEEADLIDEEIETKDKDSIEDKTLSKRESSNGKGDRVSFQFEVYCEKDVIKHNLKCVLITLQKQIGDVMVQICFVKSRKLSNEERYKQFNTTVSDLKQLKFEYTNLTDKIISSFKKPSSNKKNSNEVCVACIKEKLTDYNGRLTEVLKSGRNLKLVMRNDGSDSPQKECCSRTYPHVHAEAQGKPVVLKYSLPFEIKNPSKEKPELDDDAMKDEHGPSGSDLDPSEIKNLSDEEPQLEDNAMEGKHNPLESAFEDSAGEPKHWSDDQLSKKITPYDEWPDDFTEQDIEPPENKPAVPTYGPHVVSPDGDQTSSKTSSKSSVNKKKSSDHQPVAENSANKPTKSSFDPDGSSDEYETASKTSSKSSVNKKKFSDHQPVAENSANKPTKSSVDPDESSDEYKTASKMSSESSISKKKFYDHVVSDEDSAESTEDEPEKPNQKASSYEKGSLVSSTKSSVPSYMQDDDSDFDMKEKEKQNRRVSFFDQKQKTVTARPVMLDELKSINSKEMSQTNHRPSTESVPNLKKKANTDEDPAKTPFGGDVDNVPVYLTAIDSVVLTKYRLSISDNVKTPIQDLQEDRAVADAFKPFINDPEYMKRSPTESVTKALPSGSQTNKRSPQNKNVEELLKLGKEDLRRITAPADCFDMNNLIINYGSISNLPLSASLYSLPLDHNDLNYISRVTGKQISPEDIMLMPEDEIPVKEYEWEVKFSDDDPENNKTKWVRAFAGTDDLSEQTNDKLTSSDRNKPLVRWSCVKSPRDTHYVLPTIAEEEPHTEDNQPSHIPYMPSIPSLPLEEEDKQKLSKKKPCPSILKHNVMELRYFTVEFQNKNITNKMPKESNDSRKSKSTPYTSVHNSELKTEKEFKSVRNEEMFELSNENEGQGSSESFQSCCSSVSGLHTESSSENNNAINRKLPCRIIKPPLHATDEMIMLNVIHLCDKKKEENYVNSIWESSKINISSSSIVSNELFKEDSYGLMTNPQHCKHKMLHSDDEFTAKDNEKESVPTLFLTENKIIPHKKQNTQNKSYTVIKHEKEISDVKTETFQPRSFVVNKSYTIVKNCDAQLRQPNDQNVVPDVGNSTETKPNIVNNESKDLKMDDDIQVQNKCIEGANGHALKSQSISINQSYTIVSGQNKNSEAHCILHKSSNDLNIMSSSKQNSFLKKSYTIIKKENKEKINCNNKAIEDNTSKKIKTEKVDALLQSQQTRDFIHNKNMIPGKQKQINNCTNKGYWSKLKVRNANVKNYIAQHRSRSKESLKIKDYTCKNFKCLKRKPLIPMKSRLNYRRIEYKIRVPFLKYTKLLPVIVEYQIPIIILRPKAGFHKIFEITNDEPTTAGKIFGPIMKQNSFKSPNKEVASHPLIDYGLGKGYISVKKDQYPTNAAEFYKNKSKSVFHYKIQPSVQDKNLCRLENEYLNTQIHINSSTDSLKAKHNHHMAFIDHSLISSNSSLSSSYQQTNTSKSSIVSNKTNDYYLIDQNCNPLYLYDIHSRPLTDNSGRPLRDIKGDLLIKFDKKGLPISDSNNIPIFDTLGRSINDTDFNPTQPLSTEVFKSFTTPTGDPMLLYDIEGRPLTSVSGTMLFDASGKSLIRFGCAGNPISDSRGKPIFDSTGRNITD